MTCFIARLPVSTAQFFRQRVRQAYDDLAQPLRLAAELSLLPVLCWSARRPLRLAALAVSVTTAAEYGRRRDGGRRVFAASSALWALLWILERAVCVWLAVAWRGARRGAEFRDAAEDCGTFGALDPAVTSG